MPVPMSSPINPPVAPPAPAPASAAAIGPATTSPNPGIAIAVPTAAIAASTAPTVPPIAPPRPNPSAACERVCTANRSEEHTSELQSQSNLVCRLLLEKKKIAQKTVGVIE